VISIFSNELIQELISCPKRANKVDKKNMYSENRHSRKNIDITSLDGKYTFKMFLRKSEEFVEDFSVGLIWTNPNDYTDIKKNIILLRCQGPHDSKSTVGADIHHSYHIHEITMEDIENTRYSSPANKEVTKNFSSFSSAILHFIKICDIIEIDDYIKDIITKNLDGQIELDF